MTQLIIDKLNQLDELKALADLFRLQKKEALPEDARKLLADIDAEFDPFIEAQ